MLRAKPNGVTELVLGAPNPRVIDSFFFHVTKGREPNVGHSMLAHLSSLLSATTILTTNFDDLIEEAFDSADLPLTKFDVHQKAALPDASLVLVGHSIVKLHGGRFGLRADFTLDEEPSEADKETFKAYLGKQLLSVPRHLLVIGMSGDDARMISLIRSALKDPELNEMKVFWLCYRPDDRMYVQDLFGPQPGCDKTNYYHKNFVTTVHSDPCLFLYELHQQLSHSLPGSGTAFPAFWPVAPRPYTNNDKLIKRRQKTKTKKLKEAITTILKAAKTKPSDCHWNVIVAYGAPGVTSVAARAIDSLYQEYTCCWIDLDMYSGWHDFFVTLSDTIRWKLGAPSLVLPVVTNELETCRRSLAHLLERSERDVVVFLNAREGFGRDAGWCENAPKSDQNYWKDKDIEALYGFLNQNKIDGVVFVLMHKDPLPKETNLQCLFDTSKPFPIKLKTIDHTAESIVESVIGLLSSEKCPKPETKNDPVIVNYRFLYAMTLFRCSRHLTSLCSWGLLNAFQPGSTSGKDNDSVRANYRDEWLRVLRDKGAIRYDRGGFIWMHAEVRDRLRQRLIEEFKETEQEPADLQSFAAECHQGIADWYVKLFRSSDDPRAALESLYHRFCCIAAAPKTGGASGSADYLIRSSQIESIVTLKLAHERLVMGGDFNSALGLIDKIRTHISSFNFDDRMDIKSWKDRLVQTCTQLYCRLLRETGDYPVALTAGQSLSADCWQPPIKGIATDRWPDYERYVLYTEFRAYKDADEGFVTILKDFHLLTTWPSSTKQARDWARDWILHDPPPAQDDLKLAIKTLRRAMFLTMLMAQAKAFSLASVGQLSPDCQKLVCLQKRAEALYALATELMRSLDDVEFLQIENCYIRTNYAALLANMQRFREAHRRLNEASGYLAHSKRRTDPVSWAVIDLRRAEVLLTESHHKLELERPKSRSAALALEHDAHTSLLRAQRRLMDSRRNVWWWTWLYELQMIECVHFSQIRGQEQHCLNSPTNGALPAAGLPCRECTVDGQRCIELMQHAMRVNKLDPYRQARLVALFRIFITSSGEKKQNIADVLKEAEEHLSAVLEARKLKQPPLSADVLKYIERVRMKERVRSEKSS